MVTRGLTSVQNYERKSLRQLGITTNCAFVRTHFANSTSCHVGRVGADREVSPVRRPCPLSCPVGTSLISLFRSPCPGSTLEELGEREWKNARELSVRRQDGMSALQVEPVKGDNYPVGPAHLRISDGVSSCGTTEVAREETDLTHWKRVLPSTLVGFHERRVVVEVVCIEGGWVSSESSTGGIVAQCLAASLLCSHGGQKRDKERGTKKKRP